MRSSTVRHMGGRAYVEIDHAGVTDGARAISAAISASYSAALDIGPGGPAVGQRCQTRVRELA